MSRARDTGLSVAIAFSILSASALSGEQSGEAFSFLNALHVKPVPFAPADIQSAATSRPTSVAIRPEVSNSIHLVRATADQDISLVARHQAFIASVVEDLSSKSTKDKLVLAVTGETE